MYWLLLLLLLAGCATGGTPAATPLSTCSLANETACVEHAEGYDNESWTPFELLVVGLSDRAAQLEGPDAIDYHRRIVQLAATSEGMSPEVASRAAPSHVVVAALHGQELRDFEWAAGPTLEQQMQTLRAEQDSMRQLATFVVNNGTAESKAEAGWLLVYGLERHAELLRQVEIPAELTVTGRTEFQRRLDELVSSLEQEGKAFRKALRGHCRAESLDISVCRLAK